MERKCFNSGKYFSQFAFLNLTNGSTCRLKAIPRNFGWLVNVHRSGPYPLLLSKLDSEGAMVWKPGSEFRAAILLTSALLWREVKELYGRLAERLVQAVTLKLFITRVVPWFLAGR